MTVAVTKPATASRTRRTGWNYLASISLSVLTMSIGLFATPPLKAWLGSDKYGAFRVVSDWYGLLMLLEMGLGGAVTAMVVRSIARGDSDGLKTSMAAGIRGYIGLMIRVGLCGLILWSCLPLLIHNAAPFRRDLLIGAAVLLAGTFLMPVTPFRYLLDASQRSYIVSALLGGQSLIITGLSLILAYHGFGITGQAIATFTGAIFFSGMLLFIGLKLAPGLSKFWESAKHARHEIRSIGRPIFILHICVMVGLFSDNLIIGGILGAQMVTVFYLTQRLLTIAATQVRSISGASWAALLDLHLSGETKVFKTRVLEMTMVVTSVGVVAFVPLMVFNRAFINLWLGRDNYAGEIVTILAAVNGLVSSILALWIWLFDGTAQSRRLVPMSVISAAINVAVSILATLRFGLPGPLIGTTIALVAIQLLWTPFLLRRYFDVPVRGLFASVGRPLAIAIPFGLLLKPLVNRYEPHGWVQLGASLAAAALVLGSLIWALLLNAEQRGMWTHRVRIILGR